MDQTTTLDSHLRVTGTVSCRGMANRYDHGGAAGHVTIFTPSGSLSIAADTPVALRALAVEFARAADELEALEAQAVPS